MSDRKWIGTGTYLRPVRWSNDATCEMAAWLVENAIGATMVGVFYAEAAADIDNTTQELGARLKSIFVEQMPDVLELKIIDEINWVQVARYLLQVAMK